MVVLHVITCKLEDDLIKTSDRYTLMQSYKRTPNIFTLVQKVKSVIYFFYK